MGPLLLATKRSRAHAGLLASVGLVTAVVVALLMGLTAFLGTASQSGIASTLAAAPPTASAVLVETTLSDEPEAQSEAASAQFDTVFAGLPVSVYRSVQSSAVALERPADPLRSAAPRVLLRADPGVESHARLIAGAWPGDPGGHREATIQADAAVRLGIAVGDVLTLDSSEPVTVVGTWRALDVRDPYWFGDPAVIAGAEGQVAGPLVLDEASIAALAAQAQVRWVAVPEGPMLTAGGIEQLSSALSRLEARVPDDEILANGSTTVSGTLGATLGALSDRLAAAGAIVAVPLTLIAALGLVAVWQLVRLLASARSADTRLLRSRGFSERQLTAVTVAESLAVAVPAAILGAAGAAALLTVTAGGIGAGSMTSLWPVALGVVASVALASLLATSRSERDDRNAGSQRQALAVTSGATVVAVAAAVVSVWQLRLYGGSDDASPAGASVDPVAVVAPTVALVALGLLALLLLFPFLRLADRVAAHRRGLVPVLPVRQVARRLPVYGLVILLITLSVGGTTFASAFAQGWRDLDGRVAALRTGSDVRVAIDGPDSIRDDAFVVSAAPFAALDGVESAAPVLVTEANVGSDTIPFLALPAASFRDVVTFPGGEQDAAAVGDALTADQPDSGLTGDVTVTVAAVAPAGSARGTLEPFLWISDEDGALVRLALGTASVDEAQAPVPFTVGLPAGTWRVVAAGATLSASDGAENIVVTLAGESLVTPLNVTLSWRDPTQRAMVGGESPPSDLAVVVTDATAARLAAVVGDRLSVRLARSGALVDAVIVATTEVLPGAAGALGIAADLPSLYDYLLRTSERLPQVGEVWLRTAEPGSVSRAAAVLPTTRSVVTSRDSESSAFLVEPVLTVLWWGMAGVLFLAAVGFAAMAATLAAAGRTDVAVLRALGMPGRTQAWSRFAELGAVVVVSVGLGLGAGALVSRGTVSALAHAAVGGTAGSGAGGLTIALVPLVVLVSAFLLVAVGIAALTARRVRADADRGLRTESV